jgi:hypothetical protein
MLNEFPDQSYLCVVIRDPHPGCMILASRGDFIGRCWATGGMHPLDSLRMDEIPATAGFYVWNGEAWADDGAGSGELGGQGDADGGWEGTFRPAAAGDFERFGFPTPNGFALGTLRRIEALAVEGARSLPRTQLAARGALDEIRGEAARALACELAPAGRKPGPTVVCLCGSTRFLDAFREANRTETLAGRIVLSVGMFGHHEGLDMDGPVKAMLDRLHLAKIDLADEVLILNLDGYIGESTRRELAYARETGKVVRFLEPEGAIG